MHEQKGQVTEKSPIASLILTLAILMILFVLFIPPGEREDLLRPTNVTTTASATAKIELLSESPGLVSPTRGFGVVHQVPSINLFLKKEPKTLPLAQSLTVKNSLFSKTSPKTSFDTSTTDLKKISLVFSVTKPSGELKIFLNGNQFYAEEIDASGIKIVAVPVELVRDRNELLFEASAPGLAFWRTNTYKLSDVTLRQEFERIHAQETRQFTLSQDEWRNLENAELSYFQFCNLPLPDQTTTFKVYVNDKSVFSGLIRCISGKQTINLERRVLSQGTNTVRFLLEQGDFTYNEVKVETTSKQTQNPSYSFSLSRAQFNDIKGGNRTISFELFLEDTRVKKTARILVNDGELFLNTDANTYKQDLKDYVLEGANFIRIIPSNSFTIVGLKVVLSR